MLRTALFWLRPPATNPQQWDWELMPGKQLGFITPSSTAPCCTLQTSPLSSSELTWSAEHSPEITHHTLPTATNHTEELKPPHSHTAALHTPTPASLLTCSLSCHTLENKTEKEFSVLQLEWAGCGWAVFLCPGTVTQCWGRLSCTPWAGLLPRGFCFLGQNTYCNRDQWNLRFRATTVMCSLKTHPHGGGHTPTRVPALIKVIVLPSANSTGKHRPHQGWYCSLQLWMCMPENYTYQIPA